MLSKIEISNFKAIGENPLILNELASVNYLVGPNGCGKSSLGEYLQHAFIDLIIIHNKCPEKLIKKLDSHLISYDIKSRIRSKVRRDTEGEALPRYLQNFLPDNSYRLFLGKKFLKINFIPNPDHDKGEFFNVNSRKSFNSKFIYQNLREIYFKHIYGFLNKKGNKDEKIKTEMSLISNKVLNYFSDKTKIPTHYNSKFSSLNSIKLSSGEANIQH